MVFFYREVVTAGNLRQPTLGSNPNTRTFWMIPVSSSIVILNLIANLPLLYHKSKNTRILH